jgi:hypothetical protein
MRRRERRIQFQRATMVHECVIESSGTIHGAAKIVVKTGSERLQFYGAA